MRVLIVKLSSLGDIIHAFPALTDAARARPDVRFDWLVDEDFAALPALHPAVAKVFALPIRRFKKAPRASLPALRAGLSTLRADRYDLVIDAQGLVKSAVAARLARGRPRHGFARGSAREGLAAASYDVGHDIPETEHMAERVRKLFAAALGYELPPGRGSPGLDGAALAGPAPERPFVVLLHGTSWKTKTWTIEGWRGIAARCGAAGLDAVLFAHGEAERARAARIAEGLAHVRVMPAMGFSAIVPILAGSSGAVSVDSGLGHLAAALGLPTVGLYGPTSPALTAPYGPLAVEIAATRDCAPCERSHCAIRPDFGEGPPCLADIPAAAVWSALQEQIRVSAASG